MSRKQKIFGIGWAKTGTTTLGKCFEHLGYSHTSTDLNLLRTIMTGDLNLARCRANEFETFEDWPWPLLFKEVDQWFPGSKFVLTIRNPDKWMQSYQKMIKRQRARADIATIRKYIYGASQLKDNEATYVARYQKHNTDVCDYFKNRPGDLLVIDWENGAGWKELCDFLNHTIPEIPFPHENKGNWFHAKASNWKQRLRGSLKNISRKHQSRIMF